MGDNAQATMRGAIAVGLSSASTGVNAIAIGAGALASDSRLRQLGPAMQHYQQALVLNRRHRSAYEHICELYLVLGEPAKAEQQLALLEDICLIPCVETSDLKRAIATYKSVVTRG